MTSVLSEIADRVKELEDYVVSVKILFDYVEKNHECFEDEEVEIVARRLKEKTEELDRSKAKMRSKLDLYEKHVSVLQKKVDVRASIQEAEELQSLFGKDAELGDVFARNHVAIREQLSLKVEEMKR